MKAVILAAGVGSRLGRPYPKTLSVLPTREKILGRQIRIIRQHGIREIYVVVGFKMSLIMEEFPDVFYVYNPYYYKTNTSKSLLAALVSLHDDIVWTNGDVVFEENAFKKIIDSDGNVIGANKAKCGTEEVKYRVSQENRIVEISKHVANAEGEAVGINKVAKQTLPEFVDALRGCADSDYFEKGLEMLVQNGSCFVPVDVSEFKCIEIDFEEDWQQAKKMFA